MDIKTYILANFCNGLIGIFYLTAGYKIFDLITPKWKFHEIYKKDTITNGGLVITAYLVGLAIVIASTAG